MATVTTVNNTSGGSGNIQNPDGPNGTNSVTVPNQGVTLVSTKTGVNAGIHGDLSKNAVLGGGIINNPNVGY